MACSSENDGPAPAKATSLSQEEGPAPAKATSLSQEEGLPPRKRRACPRESGGYRLFFVIGVWLDGGNEDLEEKLWPKPQYSR